MSTIKKKPAKKASRKPLKLRISSRKPAKLGASRRKPAKKASRKPLKKASRKPAKKASRKPAKKASRKPSRKNKHKFRVKTKKVNFSPLAISLKERNPLKDRKKISRLIYLGSFLHPKYLKEHTECDISKGERMIFDISKYKYLCKNISDEDYYNNGISYLKRILYPNIMTQYDMSEEELKIYRRRNKKLSDKEKLTLDYIRKKLELKKKYLEEWNYYYPKILDLWKKSKKE